jgi:uncharacterized metal-binding protein
VCELPRKEIKRVDNMLSDNILILIAICYHIKFYKVSSGYQITYVLSDTITSHHPVIYIL